ncbi:hypothetical protein GCM10022410_16980 [Amphibacillus indicireducens]|uniref:Uncharacterized protein n=1 Tax=Amphibacillus indicireducens TaxID=1076330 RepID=A0ABP7VPW6_9BACI
MLIENLRKKKRRVVVVADRLPHEVIKYLEANRIAVIHHHDQQENKYTKAGISRAKNIIMLHQQDIDNLNEFIDFQTDFTKYKRKNHQLVVYIHLHEPQSRVLFAELDKTMNGYDPAIKVKQINIYQSFAQALFEKQSILKSVQANNSAHLLIIGFGSIGQQIALQASAQLSGLSKTKFKITALDQFIMEAKRDWLSDYPDTVESVPITFRSFDIKSDRLEEVIREQEQPVTHIFICLDDDLDLWAGIELSNKFPQVPIFIEYSEGSFAEKWIQSEVSGNRLIYSLGTFQEVLTEENIFK